MGGQKKAAEKAAEISREGHQISERRYKSERKELKETNLRYEKLSQKRFDEAISGKYSRVDVEGKRAMGEMRRGMQGSAKGQKSGFQRALGRRSAMRGYAEAAPKTLGALASARASEQMSLMGAAQSAQFAQLGGQQSGGYGMSQSMMGHSMGMMANQAQFQSQASNSELMKAGMGALGGAASSI